MKATQIIITIRGDAPEYLS